MPRDYDAWAYEAGCAGWSYARRPALFQACRGQRALRRRLSWLWAARSACRCRSTRCRSTRPSSRAAQEFGIPLQSTTSTAPARHGVGHYQVTVRNARRSLRGHGLPQADPQPAQPHGAHGRDGDADRRRGRPRRSASRSPRRAARDHRAASARSGHLRRHRLAAPAAALGHRPGRPSATRSAFQSCTTCRASARTCRTTSTSMRSASARGDHTYDNVRQARTARCGPACSTSSSSKGPVASTLFETGGFWYADQAARSPDIQFHLGLGSGIEAGVEQLKNPGAHAELRLSAAALARHGAADSADPAATPLIDPNYWADPYDAAMSLAGPADGARDHAADGARALPDRRSACPGPELDQRRGARRLRLPHLQDRPSPGRHLQDGHRRAWRSSTPDLEVHGLDGLRVCDSSIMPLRHLVQHQRADDHDRREGPDLVRGNRAASAPGRA